MGGFEDAVAVFVNRAALRVELCAWGLMRETDPEGQSTTVGGHPMPEPATRKGPLGVRKLCLVGCQQTAQQ